jgi:hypothetical protein
MFAYDIFKALERVILDYVTDANDRAKYLEDLKTAKGLYRERIMTEMFNAYMDEPLAIRKDVMNYVNMIIGIDAENLGPDKMWKYKDPQTGELKALKIDERYINSVEERLGLKTEEQRETFRTSIRKIYGQKISVDPNYDFMDNLELVKAVTDVRLKSDIAGAGSLIGALANRTNEENQKLYDRMIDTMLNKLGYCRPAPRRPSSTSAPRRMRTRPGRRPRRAKKVSPETAPICRSEPTDCRQKFDETAQAGGSLPNEDRGRAEAPRGKRLLDQRRRRQPRLNDRSRHRRMAVVTLPGALPLHLARPGLQAMAPPAGLAGRMRSIDELLEADRQREKDGFPRKIRVGRLIKPGKGGKDKVVVVPTTVEEKLIHDPNFKPRDRRRGRAGGSGDGEEGEVIGEQPVRSGGRPGRGARAGRGRPARDGVQRLRPGRSSPNSSSCPTSRTRAKSAP